MPTAAATTSQNDDDDVVWQTFNDDSSTFTEYTNTLYVYILKKLIYIPSVNLKSFQCLILFIFVYVSFLSPFCSRISRSFCYKIPFTSKHPLSVWQEPSLLVRCLQHFFVFGSFFFFGVIGNMWALQQIFVSERPVVCCFSLYPTKLFFYWFSLFLVFKWTKKKYI